MTETPVVICRCLYFLIIRSRLNYGLTIIIDFSVSLTHAVLTIINNRIGKAYVVLVSLKDKSAKKMKLRHRLFPENSFSLVTDTVFFVERCLTHRRKVLYRLAFADTDRNHKKIKILYWSTGSIGSFSRRSSNIIGQTPFFKQGQASVQKLTP